MINVTSIRRAAAYPEVAMLSGRITHAALRSLDRLAARMLPPGRDPAHQRTGRRGEEEAYFYLRKRGYVMVARNFRSPRCRGEIDLIGWDKDVLCFIEVKTRSTRNVKPAEAAVDRHKQQNLKAVAREYLRHLPATCQYRFDVLSVYCQGSSGSEFELFQGAGTVA